MLALVPTSKDASVTRKLLSSNGIPLEICPTFDALIQELRFGAAAILLPEEAASLEHNTTLRAILAEQPPWSDLPVLILTKSGADSAALNEVLRTFGNVTVLERPLRAATLLSAVQTAIRSRERQYQIRGHLADRARAEESLRIADQRKDEFLATLGHELRNPLAPLLTGLELLKLAGVKDPRAAKLTEVMQRQISHLVRLVDDLLEISRITRGVIELQSEPLDLASIVRSAVDTSRPTVDAARHELTVDVPSESIVVTGDAVRLTQVFANLLTNAAKYTNAGGHIWVAVRKEGERAIVSVRDDGIGIPPAQLASVFDMFTQVDRFESSQPGRPWHRPDLGSQSGHPSRGACRSQKSGSWRRKRVHRRPADTDWTPDPAHTKPSRLGNSRPNGFSWSMTIAMPQRRWRLSCPHSARR